MIQTGVPLAPFTTFKIGGPADFFARIGSREELQRAVELAKEKKIPIFVLGGGSNLLFPDAGFRGLVLKNEIDLVEVDGEYLHAGGGALTAALVLASARARLTGIEGWAGLPGTVGGAIRGNAGCYGVEVKDVLESAEILDLESGEITTRPASWFEFGYRHSRLKENPAIVVSAKFRLNRAELPVMPKIQEIAQLRNSKQPRLPTTGSFFKNPEVTPEQRKNLPTELAALPKIYSWQLIDAAGLRGYRVGDAQVSEQHANYIVNAGQATAAQVIELIEMVEKKIRENFGIEMTREVQIVQNPS